LPSSRRRGMLAGMAKPIARIVKLLTPKRRWAQFSLATMFVVMTALCVWLAVVVNRAHRQRDAVAAIEALGGRVAYTKPGQKTSEAFLRPFLRRWLSRDYFDEVHIVNLGDTQVNDAGLAHLQELTGLDSLWLDGTQVTDTGLVRLQGLTGLQDLCLDRTQVTDAGLAHLQGMTGLERLWLDGTQVTDAGLAQIQQALPHCRIFGQ
jgi:hypothetical protein